MIKAEKSETFKKSLKFTLFYSAELIQHRVNLRGFVNLYALKP